MWLIPLRNRKVPLFLDRVRGIGGGSMKLTNAAFWKRRPDPAPASQKWRAAMASIAGFCADGSRN
jgi:hypothetical protein